MRDVTNLKHAAREAGAVGAFLPVVAPASGSFSVRNAYYATEEEFLTAFAAALNEEYRAIVDAGLMVQIDDAFLPYMYSVMLASGTEHRYRQWAEMCVRVTKAALRDIPPDRSRYHVCWGSWNGPHVHDVPLADIVDLLLEIPVGGFAIEHANPRHEHEWHVWEGTALPEKCTLIPGVISHATNVVEHPELVAERIVRLARVVGRDRVIAGTDCGFAQAPSMQRVHPSIMWAKLSALVEGARLATASLWS
jgi:5-methyltetrahydropteroyltriglutamate--homocysteine methyltransferase